ncbi:MULTISPECIES: hypothetical protein [Cyanophyceae]|uniref:Uncharacterized protein n=1 Tax=Leptolyngbya subtilissima DQ-A4 TaxID=2933933 RepID=A0ABV0JXW8_9CYAN|nr:hypothetical protein [Nodosilinea sp. FACHB-141]MBD2112005.1 hypothetical protein [Nodosilinea sp. FACHB-141]
MTRITLDLSPELEIQLRAEAAKQGLDPQHYILETLHTRLAANQTAANHLLTAETDLIQHINLGLSGEMWDEYYALIDKRQAESLTADEHHRLIEISDQIEALNVERIQALVQLAALRQQSLENVMDDLGIKPIVHG